MLTVARAVEVFDQPTFHRRAAILEQLEPERAGQILEGLSSDERTDVVRLMGDPARDDEAGPLDGAPHERRQPRWPRIEKQHGPSSIADRQRDVHARRIGISPIAAVTTSTGRAGSVAIRPNSTRGLRHRSIPGGHAIDDDPATLERDDEIAAASRPRLDLRANRTRAWSCARSGASTATIDTNGARGSGNTAKAG